MIEKLLSEVRESLSGIKAFLSGNFVAKTDYDALSNKLDAQIAATNTATLALEAEKTVSAEAKKQAADAQASVTTLTSENASLKTEVGTLKDTAQTVDQAASKKAMEICAAQGIKADKLPAAIDAAPKDDAKELEKVRAEMDTETDPEKRHALAQRARQLRGHSDLFTKTKK